MTMAKTAPPRPPGTRTSQSTMTVVRRGNYCGYYESEASQQGQQEPPSLISSTTTIREEKAASARPLQQELLHPSQKRSRGRSSIRRPSSNSSSFMMLMTTMVCCILFQQQLISQQQSFFVGASYTIEVGPNSEECFIFRTPATIPKGAPSVLIGSFECLEDDVETKELSVTLTDLDNGENVYESPAGSLEGDFRLENVLNGPDRYSLCFQNNYEKGADDDEYSFDVGFNIRVHTPPRALEEEEGPDNERATKLIEKAGRIHEDWDVLRDHFDFLRNREAIHKKMNDQIMSRLTRWNTIEALLVVAIATAQIMYFRAFFEKRRYL
mmetsp:Transcript_35400/g.85666  ORF Transcript_35400/g.85666 Transcript_35400/m.85666 type:complete len:325 (-) Transcript_35400:260-1234(-)